MIKHGHGMPRPHDSKGWAIYGLIEQGARGFLGGLVGWMGVMSLIEAGMAPKSAADAMRSSQLQGTTNLETAEGTADGEIVKSRGDSFKIFQVQNYFVISRIKVSI